MMTLILFNIYIIQYITKQRQYIMKDNSNLQISFLLIWCIFSLCLCEDKKAIRISKYAVIIESALLTQYGIKNLWAQTLHQSLIDPNLDHIIISQTIVTIQGLQKLFSYELPNLKSFTIVQTIVTKPIMEYLFSIDKIYQLETLWLQNDNIHDEDFANLVPRQAKFQYLILSKNQLTGQGLKFLTKLKMPNLIGLDLTYNSLITDLAADSLISYGLSNIEVLDLSLTSISEFNLLKVMRALNTNKLKRISFGRNRFSSSFYQQFSYFSFQSLQHLSLSDLQLDEDGFKWLKDINFPSLKTLNLQMNQLSNQIGKQFITKKNMPLLEKINLDNNFINSTFFKHLSNEKFAFTDISCNIERMDNEGLKQIGNLDLSRLSAIQFKTTVLNQQILIEFLNKVNVSSMVSMDFSGSANKGNYIPHILNRKWDKLQILILDEVEEFSIQGINTIIFPKLNVINIIYSSIPEEDTVFDMIKNFQTIAPNLMRIDITVPIAPGIIGAIIDGQFKHSITQKLYLSITQFYPTQYNYKIWLYTDKKPQLEQFYLTPLFISYSLYSFRRGNIQDFDLQDIMNFDIAKIKLKVLNKITQNINLDQIQQLVEEDSLEYIRKVVNDNNRKYVFKKMKSLLLGINENSDLQILKYCEFPLLTTLAIRGSTQTNQQDQDDININFQFTQNKFPYLEQFIVQKFMNKQSLKQFFKLNNLNNLLGFLTNNINNLHASDIIEIQKLIPNFHRVRAIRYPQTYINNDLTFLTTTKIKPQHLDLSNILFAPGVLTQLCDINLQFLLTLQLSSTGIDDKTLLDLFACMQKKYNRTIYFPKLNSIKMNKNYISKAGFTKLLQMGIPNLHSIQFAQNMDFEIFNTIFTSPNSKHLRQFMIDSAKFYGIDPTINPKHLRRVKSLAISSASLHETDIQALSKFDFFSLQIIKLIVSRIQSCKFLQQILHLCKNANKVELAFKDSANLNTTCLINKTQDFPLLAPEVLMVLSDDYGGQMKYFIQKLIGINSQITILRIANTPVPIQNFIQMLQTSDLTRLVIFQIQNSDLNDQFGKTFFRQPMPQLMQVSLSGNDLTDQSFAYMKNQKHQHLSVLDLSNNKIGDKGIAYLVRNQFPALTILNLKNTGITKQGLVTLGQLKAARLLSLDLSCNGLTFEDLNYLNIKNFRFFSQLVIYPEMKLNEVIKLSKLYQEYSMMPFGIQIKTNIIDLLEYHLQEDVYDDEEDQETM